MAISVIAIVELATAFNFELALIQKPDPRHEHFDTAWTLNILIAIAGAPWRRRRWLGPPPRFTAIRGSAR